LICVVCKQQLRANETSCTMCGAPVTPTNDPVHKRTPLAPPRMPSGDWSMLRDAGAPPMTTSNPAPRSRMSNLVMVLVVIVIAVILTFIVISLVHRP
jgi:hypothetical protein